MLKSHSEVEGGTASVNYTFDKHQEVESKNTGNIVNLSADNEEISELSVNSEQLTSELVEFFIEDSWLPDQ